MGKFAPKDKSFALAEGHVQLKPTEDGYSLHFLPIGNTDPLKTYAMIGVIVRRPNKRWGWTPWHGRYQLPDVNRLEEAAQAVVSACMAAIRAVEASHG